ncbi:CsbD family protein [Mesorhizobium onobrychidis]|uniref:CsbD family protein n=1 Tax=Mesorhizobium onobrychidis TaxID=2775404 RepID=A0ABY5QV65_9HYPH|nr:CsbD family protein [Mesorhizobium onobrychidis]UVC13977.1 CsbD family protein [Mesorhizobium onobrychidis]
MVNRDEVVGLAKQLKGSVKKAAGKATGNRRVQAEGAADKIAGKMQKAYGDMKDKLRKVL